MEIQPNRNHDPVARATTGQVKTPPAAAAVKDAAFEHTAALEKSLQATPAARPEEVTRAKELVQNVNYPPQETIQRIATLLALSFAAQNNSPDTQA